MGRSVNSDAYKYQKILMTCTGLWPKRNASKFYKYYGYFNYGLAIVMNVTLLLSTFVVTDFSQLIHAWSMFISISNCCVKNTIFYFKMPAFLNLLDFLDSSHFTYYDDKFDHYLKKSINFAVGMVKMFFGSCIVTVLSMLMSPLMASDGQRFAPIPFPLNFNEHSEITYFAVYVFHSVALCSAAFNSVGFDNVCTSMMGLCSAYFSILHESIVEGTEKLKNTRNADDSINRFLSECVEHHLAVIHFTESIESIFSYVFLGQFVCSAGGICLAGFTFINTEPGSPEFIFALSFLGTLMFQITLYCSYGNEVTLQSGMIRDACYMTEWIYCGPLVRKSLFLMMERSKRPMVLTAGKFINLSLTSLVMILKSAGSYAAVLYQLYNK